MNPEVGNLKLREQIFEDWRVNRGYPKSQVVLALFRVAQAVRRPLDLPPSAFAIPCGVAYRFVSEILMGIELPWRTRVGRRLRIFHGVGLVVNEGAWLGDDVILRQGVTIGNDGSSESSPTLEDAVDVGAGAVILGGITIGAGSRIGANAVVVRSCPSLSTVVGVPGRVLGARLPGDPGCETLS